jgi:hypothetical protein
MTPRATSTERTASRTSGTSSSRAGAHLERLARGQRDHAPTRPDLDGPVDDTAALEVLGVPLVLAQRRRDAAMHQQVLPRSASAASRPS